MENILPTNQDNENFDIFQKIGLIQRTSPKIITNPVNEKYFIGKNEYYKNAISFNYIIILVILIIFIFIIYQVYYSKKIDKFYI